MKRSFLFFSVIVINLVIGCKEPYYPELDDTQKLLVVEGLLTDESNLINVKLSYTAQFQDNNYIPEEGATVTVRDNSGIEFAFNEKSPGNYESKNFLFEYGQSYTLTIITKSNKKYQSTPQTLYAKNDLDPVTYIIKSKTMESVIDNEVILNTLPGVEFSTNLNVGDVVSPFFRFSNTVLVEYIERIKWLSNPDSIPGFFYCWKKYYPNDFFNLNDPTVINPVKYNHLLAFCPIDTSFYNIIQKEVGYPSIKYIIPRDLYYFAITVKKYHLNEDVHKYYMAVNDQLEANNRIFDPISFQVKGNITCIDDPKEIVLGVFEASSVSIKTYSFSDFQFDKSIKYDEIVSLDIDSLPYSGSFYDEYPPFWIFNY